MGYNISETTGATGGGTLSLDTWTFTIDLSDPSVTTVSGDFDEIPIGGGSPSEADDGYTFSDLSTTLFGSLSVADPVTGEFTFLIDRAAVIASGEDQTVSFTVTGDGGPDGSDTDTVVINLLICVLEGTLIDTPSGQVPVEQLEVGDLVETLGNGAQAIRWIGSRRLQKKDLEDCADLRPIKISKEAFGRGLPSRDLWVSPQHRIYLADWRAELLFGEQEVLVPAKSLVNDQNVFVDHTLNDVSYFHLLFDQHEVMLTEDLPTESFHPNKYALSELGDASRVELLKLFPELFQADGIPETACVCPKVQEAKVLSGYLQ